MVKLVPGTKKVKNMKSILLILFLLQSVFSEETYDPSADALNDIKNAITLAKKNNKHVYRLQRPLNLILLYLPEAQEVDLLEQ